MKCQNLLSWKSKKSISDSAELAQRVMKVNKAPFLAELFTFLAGWSGLSLFTKYTAGSGQA